MQFKRRVDAFSYDAQFPKDEGAEPVITVVKLGDYRFIRFGKNELLNLDVKSLSRCAKIEVLNLFESLLKRLDLTALFSCASLKSLLVPEETRSISKKKFDVELLNPPALNELITKERIEFSQE